LLFLLGVRNDWNLFMNDVNPFYKPAWADDRPVLDRPRILVVDDEPVNVQALYQIFGKDSEVFMAISGRQALEVCRQKYPDLILMDVVMPDMDGIAACKALKAEAATRDIPVIFVTSHNSAEEEALGLEVGAVDFISKPINPAVVRARVKTHLTLKYQSDVLRRMVSSDGLTGIPNRRLFDERMDVEWRASRRSMTPLSVMMIDVDYFKNYNDHYGHLEGDNCLKMVASSLLESGWRGRDLVARYGGEEFVCLMSETDMEGGMCKAEILRKHIESMAIPHAGSSVSDVITVSIGVATVIPGDDITSDELIRLADEQLYKAKLGGRNRVCGVPPL
jgi:diguanylate cyclase (GGDEF)-like protein